MATRTTGNSSDTGARADFIGHARLAAVVDSSDDAIISKTLEGLVQTWNAAAERLFGYSAEEIIGKPITTVIPAELWPEEVHILNRLRLGERIDHFETVRLTKAGQRIPVSLTVSPVRDAHGTIIGASKIARDISERNRAERLLLDTQEQLKAHADALIILNECTARLWSCHTPQAGIEEILDTALVLLKADKGHVQLLHEVEGVLRITAQRGFDEQSLEAFREIPVHDDSTAGRAVRSAVRITIEDLETDSPYESLRVIGRTAGGRALVSTPLIGPDGTPFGMLSIFFARKHRPTEQQLRTLDLLVRQACDFIRRCRIEQALRLREESLREGDRRKDEFLALLAHELRNPLAPVRYALATLRKPGLTDDQRTRANEVIERQVIHMSLLLDDLLDVSRITRGTIELKKSSTDLGAVIGAAIDAARPVIETKEHQLEVELPAAAICLEADAVRLTQVFSNLLINAAKYTDPKGSIRVKAVRAGQEAVISVLDNGIGIAPEILPRLFTLFTQARSALERSEGGLGVGLALVRGLVTLHGGWVEARSAGLSHGSEFIVHLPATAPAAAPVPIPVTVPGVDMKETVDGKRTPDRVLDVMIVDDNQDVADSCAALLELSGHRVRAAYTAKQGFDLAQALPPDVMLLDIGLPEVSGYELADRIRATPWGRNLVLIAVTGWGAQSDRDRAFECGFDHHLTKPISTDELDTLLQSLRPRTQGLGTTAPSVPGTV